MKIEKKDKNQQIFFGKIVALQPKKAKKDKGAEGTPLFTQEFENESQLNIFDNKNKETNNGNRTD